VIYFFTNGCEYVQCEIRSGRPHVLTFVLPDGSSESERYASTVHLMARWREVTDAMEHNGWTGPFGRDPRS
jgi:hypothetical protein